jgi:hypothetical protein
MQTLAIGLKVGAGCCYAGGLYRARGRKNAASMGGESLKRLGSSSGYHSTPRPNFECQRE